MVLLALPLADHLWTNVCARARDAGRRARAAYHGAAAQTRMLSVARIRLVSCKSTRLFKGIICDDISEFESHMPSHAVGLCRCGPCLPTSITGNPASRSEQAPLG